MEIEKQVCSLKLAKRLKELGAKQDSYWAWVHPFRAKDLEHFHEEDNKLWKLLPRQSMAPTQVILHHLAAYTVAELGEMLPHGHWESGKVAMEDMYFCSYERDYEKPNEETDEVRYADTEANARANMLIYLIKNKLIEAEDAR